MPREKLRRSPRLRQATTKVCYMEDMEEMEEMEEDLIDGFAIVALRPSTGNKIDGNGCVDGEPALVRAKPRTASLPRCNSMTR